jgi:hypothetical protein
MQRTLGHFAAMFAASFIVGLWGPAAASAATPDARGAIQHSREAPALVQAALDAEAAGDAATRAKLLSEAGESDPDYAPAHWHNGELMFDGKWRSLAQIENLVANHPRWTGYAKLRESLGEAPDAHRQLAEYCQKNRLGDEGRFHWANILLAEPQNQAARKQLGLQAYEGGLFTAEQVARLEQSAKDAKENLAKLRPRFTALCRDAVSSNVAKRLAALQTLGETKDPAVLTAMEQAVAKAATSSPDEAVDLHRAMVMALTNMPQHAATLRLLNYAVFSHSPELRRLAAKALKPRPQTDYVPILMSALTARVEVQVDVLASPDGTVRMLETVSQVGPETEAVRMRSANFETEGAFRSDPTMSDQRAVLQGHLSAAEAIAADTQARADAANEEAEARNARIKEALQVAAGLDSGDDAEEAWASWASLNELYSPERVTYRSYDEFTSVYAYPQLKPMYVEEEAEGDGRRSPEGGAIARSPEPAAWRNPAAPRADLLRGTQRVGVNTSECFVPGTPVWTPRGPRPIETISVGDLVLAQNPETGELAFRAVLETTLGPPSRIVSFRCAKETISTTLGHRFWVNRRGWTMAKSLQESAELHGLHGPVRLEAVLNAEDVPCHNLIVDEFHTYFVGESQILVHDKGCPIPVIASVPGSATIRSLPTLDPPLAVAKSGW